MVHDPKAMLYAADLAPGSDGLTVTTWWTLRRGDKSYAAIASSNDRFETAAYERGTWPSWAKQQPLTTQEPGPAIDAFRGLITARVKSLAPGIEAVVAGGDGATLLPFGAVARSADGGDWESYVVPLTHGDQAYTAGSVVLPDGRLLVLLDAWSSDRGWTRPGPEHHGLWVSARRDWARYTPYRPPFSPKLAASDRIASIDARPGVSRRAPHGLLFATTRENRLYVSTDGAHTFHEVRAR